MLTGPARLLLAAALLAGAAAQGASHEALYTRYEFSSRQMGTEARIVLYSSSEAAARDASSRAFARIAALDQVMSDYREDSELTALCRRAGTGPVRVSQDLFRVLDASMRLSRASAGAFDVTAGPLVRLWRRARRIDQLPPRADIHAAQALVGVDKIALDPRARTVDLRVRGMQLDLGGIGKGFAVDAAVRMLRQRGHRGALVALGGDIAVLGAPPGKTGWTIDVADLSPDAAMTQVVLRDAAISTSGDAEQWVEIDGVRYSHIIDPRTGMALDGRRSVTVIAPTGTLSDGLATAASVLGPAAGLALLERTKGAAGRMSFMEGDAIRRVVSRRWRYFVAGGSGPISTLRNSTSAPSA